ncbi:MAG: CDP-alcohol phosphatidyltransferase family protein [Labilithrix sp.]|nr:CDP-alcohol phosphatidyltransferase family protein [Labilithrix sp.]
MPAYRTRDLLVLPNLVSAARVPLALAFPFAKTASRASLLLAAAGLTDVLDGWLARRRGQATPLGAVVDGFADKVFAASVLSTLVRRGRLSWASALLLAARELVELPLAARVLASPSAPLFARERGANALGKLATVLEHASALVALLGARPRRALVAATAIVGLLAATSYWRREIRAVRARARGSTRPAAHDALVDLAP